MASNASRAATLPELELRGGVINVLKMSQGLREGKQMDNLIKGLLAFMLGAASLAPGLALQTAPAGQSAGAVASSADSTAPQGPHELKLPNGATARKVPTREGEICAVCGKPVSEHGIAYQVEGQRVALHRGDCLGVFNAQPERWLRKLKPRGAFLDASATTPSLSSNFLFLGLYVLAGLLFGALAAHRALSVGRNPLAWLAVGLVTTLPGFLALLTLPKGEVKGPAGVPSGLAKIATTYAPAACPVCGTENHPSALKCLGCGSDLSPKMTSEVARAGLRF